jgi:hypothetical protein
MLYGQKSYEKSTLIPNFNTYYAKKSEFLQTVRSNKCVKKKNTEMKINVNKLYKLPYNDIRNKSKNGQN